LEKPNINIIILQKKEKYKFSKVPKKSKKKLKKSIVKQKVI